MEDAWSRSASSQDSIFDPHIFYLLILGFGCQLPFSLL